MSSGPVIRESARVVVIDALDRVLLLRLEGIFDDGATTLWVPPGGGLEPGETHEQAAKRELAEEIDLADAELGPCIWLRTWIGPFHDHMIESRERYFVCRVGSHEIGEGHVNPDELERAVVAGYRWWTIDEIEASSDLFLPRSLGILLPAILRGELPAEPLFVEHRDSRDNPPLPRPTVRVLLLDPDNRVFLLHSDAEHRGGEGPLWLTPGGGLEAGESHEEAARRELQEEVGLTDVTLGRCVWLRALPYVMDGVMREKQERYYVARVPAFEVDWTTVDLDGTLGGRWWSVPEIEASGDLFVPRALGLLLQPILRGVLPSEAIIVDF